MTYLILLIILICYSYNYLTNNNVSLSIKYKICFCYIFATIIIILCSNIILKYFFNESFDNKTCLIGDKKKLDGIFNNGCIDIFHVSHFLFWMLIGLHIPNKFILILIISICWETFEHFLFKYDNSCDDIFCGRVEDIFLNISGYFIGSCLIN